MMPFIAIAVVSIFCYIIYRSMPRVKKPPYSYAHLPVPDGAQYFVILDKSGSNTYGQSVNEYLRG